MKKILIVSAAALLLLLGCDLAALLLTKNAAAEDTSASEDVLELSEAEISGTYEEIADLIFRGRVKEAMELLEGTDTESAEYYFLKELAYIEDGSEEAEEALRKLYLEAADRWPNWQHMQKMAGAAMLSEGNYEAAAYRLYEALRLDTEDADTWYYLGVAAYYEGNYDDMRSYFESALERGLSETKQAQVLWFAEEVGDRE